MIGAVLTVTVMRQTDIRRMFASSISQIFSFAKIKMIVAFNAFDNIKDVDA